MMMNTISVCVIIYCVIYCKFKGFVNAIFSGGYPIIVFDKIMNCSCSKWFTCM